MSSIAIEADDSAEACTYEVYAGSLETPPEYCDDDAEPGSEYCTRHREKVERLEALVDETMATED